MNEEALKDAYNLFVQQGYKKSIDEFKQLIATNPDALKDSYNLFTQQGYNKTIDDYKTLMGVSDVLKKKEEPILPMAPQQEQVPSAIPGAQPFMGSPLAGTSSESPSPISDEQPVTPITPVRPTDVPPVRQQMDKTPLGVFNQKITDPNYDALTPDEQARAVKIKYPITKEEPKKEEAPKEEKTTLESVGNWINNTAAALDRGFAKNLIGNPIKGLGTIIQGLNAKVTGTSGKEPITDALINFGNYYNNLIDELAPQDEAYKNSLSDQFAQAFGQVASLIVTGGASKVAGTAGKSTSALQMAELASQAAPKTAGAVTSALETFGKQMSATTSVSAGLSMGQSEFDRAKAAGATDDQAFEVFLRNMAVGSTLETLPVMGFLKRFEKASAGGVANYLKTKGVAGIVGGTEEMTTEVLQQLYANKTAKDVYNINQDLFEGVGGSGGVGFGVGFLLNAMGANAKILRNQGKEAEAAVIEKQIQEFEEKPKGPPPSYKLNGIVLDPEVAPALLDKMSGAELIKSKLEIKNDPTLELKIQDKIVNNSVKEQVRQGNPNLNEPSLNAITDLEVQLKKIEGNTTQTGKDKAAAIRTQIKDIQENQIQEEATLETVKSEQDAIQKQATNEGVLRTGQPEVGLQEVGKGNVQPEVATAGTKETITPQSGTQEVAATPTEAETRRQEEFKASELNDNVIKAKNEIAKADDTEAAIEEYNKAKKIEEEFQSQVEQRKEKVRKQSNIETIIEDVNNDSKQEDYEYKDLYTQDPRLAALQAAKDMVKFAKSGDLENAYIKQGNSVEEAKEFAENAIKRNERDIADLEANIKETPVVSLKTQEVAPAEITPVIEVEQYVPITEKEVSHEAFTRDNAIDYEEDYKTGDNGREYSYISRLTVELLDNDGNAIGRLIKLVDEDGIMSFQAEDIDGNELSLNGFDTKGEAKKAIVDKWNKTQKKEFDREVKKKAKETEKAAQKQAKKTTKKQVNEQPTVTPTPEPGPIAGNRLFNKPLKKVAEIADRYYKRIFGTDRPKYYGSRGLDEARAKRIADAYEKMKHNPNDPEVKAAYEALAKETLDQYKDFLDAGFTVEINDDEPYDNSQDMINDLRDNNRIKIFSTESGFGDNKITKKQRAENPLLQKSGYKDVNGKPLLINDVFRAIHDFFGHAELGNSFGAKGEENAWNIHSRMYSPIARRAMTSETRGQNSFVNFSGVNEEINKLREKARKLRQEGDIEGAKAIVKKIYEEGSFAEQKIGLLPEEFSEIEVTDIGDVNLQPQGLETREVSAEEQGITDELMNLDVNDEDSLKRILDALDRVDENISKKLFGGANESLLAIPLGTVQLVIKSLKALVKGGMLLRDAIRKVATDNNISQESIKDILNIAPIQEGFNSVMSKVDAMIERQKQRGVEERKIISNVDTLVRNEEVYKNADDSQKKILEREARVKLGAKPRRAPSIGRVLGVLKDITNISRQEKLQVIKQIRELSRDAAKDLANEIRELAKSGTITPTQAANVIARFGKVNMLNEVSVSNFVDYMSKVFENADYVNKIQQINNNLKTAKKNIGTKIGTADGLIIQLQRLFSINPTLIPEESFNKYSELVNMFGQKQAVLSLEEKSKVIKDVNSILENIDEQESKANVLADRFNQFEGKIFDDEGRLQYADTINQMVKEEVIDDNEAELMRKYKSDIAPQVGKTKMTDEEIAEEKKELIQALNKTQVDTAGLPTQYQRALANRLKNLVSTKAIEELSNTDLKNLLKVFDNINNNYLPHYAQVMVEKLNSVNDAKNLTSAFKRAVIAPLSGLYSRVKSLILGSKRTGVSEMVRRNPLFYIDQLFGDFKTKDIFNAVFNKVSEGESKFKSDLKRVQNILEKAEERVAKSFNLNGNDTLMSKFKMMTYMVQLEYDSNQGSKQVNPAADYLKATIKHIDEGKSQFGERDANMLQKILKEFAPNGEIDNQKLYDSFNNAEKSALKDIRGINESLREKAEDTAAIIRGDRINALTNYVHLNVLHEHQPNDLTSGVAFVSDYNNSLRPSTKAKSLIERTGKVSPLNFDVFASAQRGAKFVLMDYNLTEPIRTARKTIKQTVSNFEEEGRIPKEKRQIINAIDSAFEEATENVLTNTFLTNSLADDFVDYVNKQGYRAVLAGTSRFVSELSSNVGFAIILDPKAFATGVANKGFIMSANAPLVMENVNSKETNRIFPTDTLSGRVIDTNILQQTSGIKGAKSKNSVANKTQQIWNLSGKKVLNTVELTADALISTPDKLIMRPMWFGSFANEFKNITGEKVNLDKIAANDESYMNQYEEAIEKAKTTADERAVMTGATDNPFMGILKGTVKPDQKFLTRSFNNFNNFMTRFMIYEYVAARTGIMAAMGNGSLTKKQGVAVLGAVTTRMVVYTLMIQMLGTGLMGLVFGDGEEPEDEKSFMQKLGQAFASAFTSLVLGRDFGNATKQMINIGVERVNENYLDFLREGDYDPYKDAIQYSIVPPEKKGKQTSVFDFLLNMGGAFGPALKTADLIGRKILEPKKEEDDAIERQEDEIKIRIPLEILGNLGFIPLYKDIRKVVLKNIYSSLEEAERTAADKKKAEKEKLHGYKNKSDMERYDPELWDKVYGPNSPDYDKNEAIKEIKRAKEKLEREAKDEMYDYVPKSSKTYKFGPQKSSGKSKSEYKFGPQSGTKKSEYKFGPQ